MQPRVRVSQDYRTDPYLDSFYDNLVTESLLTADEECRLAALIKSGDRTARDRMFMANLRLVRKIAGDYRGGGLSFEDLISEGQLGLMRACTEYDPSFGTRFSTYASHWIKQSIRHALTNTTAMIRLPAHMVGLMTKWRRTERALHKELGQVPTDDQIAVTLGITEAQRKLIAHAKRAGQIRYESNGNDDGGWSADDSPDLRVAPDMEVETNDEQNHILGRLNRLDNRERMIVSLRYGLQGNAPLTLKEVGKRLQVTREWVRKIEIRAINKMKDDFVPPEPTPSPTSKSKKPRRDRSVRTMNAKAEIRSERTSPRSRSVARSMRVLEAV